MTSGAAEELILSQNWPTCGPREQIYVYQYRSGVAV